jgi:excisionase family DNA binding protein
MPLLEKPKHKAQRLLIGQPRVGLLEGCEMYLTVREVADRLRISQSSVYLLIESGRLAHHRLGARRGAIRVSEDDLAAYLAENRQDHRRESPSSPTGGRVKLKHIQY